MQAALQRTLVLDLFSRVMEGGELADHALARALRRHKELHSSERRQVGEMLYAMIRLHRRFDFLLSAGLAQARLPTLKSIATPDVDRLRYAAALATETSEPAAAALRLAGAEERFVSVIEHLVHGEAHWPKAPVAQLAVRGSLPDWAAARFLAEYGDEAQALADVLNVRAPLTLRANTLKGTREALAEKLREEHIPSSPGTLSPWSLILEGRHNVFGLAAYKAGLFDLQDEGSQLVALATGAKPGQRVFDACCGAGGKALALAAMTANKGVVLCGDVSEERLEDVKPRARLAGAFNFQFLIAPEGPRGDKPLRGWRARTDVTLVDAPCSGTGAWRRHADGRWRMTEAEADAFPARQLAILDRYAQTVKPGGRLVYATCSLLRAENEDVAAQFREQHPEFTPDPLTELPSQVLDSEGRMKTLPHRHGTDGFFAAAFRRA